MTTPMSDEPMQPGSGPQPAKVAQEEGYQPVRQDTGDPVVPRTEIPAPQPMTLQPPPRRVMPTPVAEERPTAPAEARPEPEVRTGTEVPADEAPRQLEPEVGPKADADEVTSPATPEPATAIEAEPTAAEPTPTSAAPASENMFARPAPEATPASPSSEAPREIKPGQPRRMIAGDLVTQLNVPPPAKAQSGLRAFLGMGPSRKERDEAADLAAARKAFDRPVTVMIANPKGGVGKTPLTLLLAGVFGVARGGGVIAWDNNELRGTMPDRSVSEHRQNVRDLLAEADRLKDAGFTEVARFLNHQTSGTFHTLGSAQGSGQSITHEDFEVVHDILGRYFEMIFVDTGNNEAAPNWLAAAETADCLVVPTKWRKDSLIPAARMLESLQDSHPELLERTLIVATNGPAEAQEESRKAAANWFGSQYPVLEIPTDPHIAAGDVLKQDELTPETRRAALAIAAAIVEKLD